MEELAPRQELLNIMGKKGRKAKGTAILADPPPTVPPSKEVAAVGKVPSPQPTLATEPLLAPTVEPSPNAGNEDNRKPSPIHKDKELGNDTVGITNQPSPTAATEEIAAPLSVEPSTAAMSLPPPSISTPATDVPPIVPVADLSEKLTSFFHLVQTFSTATLLLPSIPQEGRVVR